MTIAILGIGGVGGYIGGKLAIRYHSGNDRIIFITRGENQRIINAEGLKLITPSGEELARPYTTTNDPLEIGIVDVLICCIKGYDLEESIRAYSQCISGETIVIPLLNGVDAPERIKLLVPQAEVWDGCVYIISQLTAPGRVTQSGSLNHIYLGSGSTEKSRADNIKTILLSAGLNVTVEVDISKIMWEKFFFISPLATLTSFVKLPIGKILSDSSYKEKLLALMNELYQIVKARNISLPENIIKETLHKLSSLPYETTSSMEKDFQKGKRTELKSLTGYVVESGKHFHIATPMYAAILENLQARF